MLILLLRFYQRFLSPMLGAGKCRFTPTCSSYALLAVQRYGSWKGSWLGLWRILRCQPLCRGGYDPVPLPPQEPPAST